MSTASILATFISRKTGQVLLQANLRGPSGIDLSGASVLNRLNPFSISGLSKPKFAPKPSSINYNTDITQFTDSFDFSIALAEDEGFSIDSHDFVEFAFQKDDFTLHQIGVGFIEDIQRISNADGVTLQGNGRDFFGHLLNVPFKKQLKRESLRLNRFINRLLKDSYLEEYLSLRNPFISSVRDLGSFSPQMIFYSDLEQKKAQVLQKYADLAINLVYMNRLGQVEILGRPGVTGSTAFPFLDLPVGTLKKGNGSNILSWAVRKNYSNVFSEFTVFYSEGEAQLDLQAIVSPAFKNSDARVQDHIFQPGFTTYNSTDLVTIGGGIPFINRVRDLGKAQIRKSNRDLNSVIVVSDNTGETVGGVFVPFQIGQPWILQSNEREFTSPRLPSGTDTIQLVISAISYQATEEGTQCQLRMIERDALL